MTVAKTLQFFDDHRERLEPLVLATVIETRGSTYSKVGTQMLINANGVFHGMLSGGCLERDLGIRAQVVLDSGNGQVVDYDLAVDDDLWGLGVGCDGMMRIQLQPLSPDQGYAPFAEIADILRGNEARDIQLSVLGDTQARLTIRISPPPNLLVLGAGVDAEPVVRLASVLGWRCTIADHRPAYIDNGDFQLAAATYCVVADHLQESLELGQYNAAIVMSHHLVSDRSYLSQLAGTDIAYIGLLGPGNRRERLLDEIGVAAIKLEARLYGPAGLDLGGRGPESIALSIIAQIEQALNSD